MKPQNQLIITHKEKKMELEISSNIIENLLENDEYLSGILKNIVRKKLETLVLEDGTSLNDLLTKIYDIETRLEGRLTFIEQSLNIYDVNYNDRSLRNIVTRIEALEDLVYSLGLCGMDYNERRIDNINSRLKILETKLENNERKQND